MQQDVRQRTVRDYAIALALFGLISGILLWTVRIKAPEQQGTGPRLNSKIYAISRDPAECQPNHRQLVKWLPVLDPSRIAMSQADSPYLGDDWISSRQFLGLQPEPLPPLPIEFKSTPDYVFPFRQPAIGAPAYAMSGAMVDGLEWPIPPPRKETMPLGVHWFQANMVPLKSPPVMNVTGLERPDAAGKRFCVIEVTVPQSSDRIPRIRLERRSGLFTFDQAVVRQCMRWLRGRMFEDETFRPPRTITVVWAFGTKESTAPKPVPKPTPKTAPKPPATKTTPTTPTDKAPKKGD